MLGIGGFELFIILIFGFILVGDRLPDVAKTLGRALRTFQNAQRDMSKVIKEDVFDPDAEDPFKDPLAALDKMGGIAKKTSSSLAGDLNEMAAAARKKKVAPADAAAPSDKADESVAEAEVAAAEAAPEAAPTETFAERRARYERERAARLAAQAEERAASEAEAAAAAVQAADEAVAAVEAAAQPTSEAGKEEQ